MSENVFYCKKWSVAYKEPIDLLSKDDAYKLHSRGAEYTVLIGSDTKPSCFIHVIRDKGWVSVSFLDDDLKEFLLYSFKLLDNGTLFLSMAVHREFAKNGERGVGFLNVSSGTTYLFNEDGNTIVREESFEPHVLEESQTVTDISGNYDHFPEFGHYESLIRIER